MKIFIKPAIAGNIVRHPEKMDYTIADEGEWVENSPQWQRYLVAGDVVEMQQDEIKEDTKPKKESK